MTTIYITAGFTPSDTQSTETELYVTAGFTPTDSGGTARRITIVQETTNDNA